MAKVVCRIISMYVTKLFYIYVYILIVLLLSDAGVHLEEQLVNFAFCYMITEVRRKVSWCHPSVLMSLAMEFLTF